MHHAKQTLIKDLSRSNRNSTVQINYAPKQVGVCYIYFTTYAQNREKSAQKGGGFNTTSWAYITYSTVQRRIDYMPPHGHPPSFVWKVTKVLKGGGGGGV